MLRETTEIDNYLIDEIVEKCKLLEDRNIIFDLIECLSEKQETAMLQYLQFLQDSEV